MKPAPFAYERPDTIAHTLAALDRHGADAKVLAGGQSLIPMLNLRLLQPERLIDVGRIEALRRIERTDGELRIGAAATHNAILTSAEIADDCPLIVAAYQSVAHHGVRNRGTLGGSLCHNDPAAEMPMIMSVLEATLVVQSVGGVRHVPAADFFVGMFETALKPNELLTEIRIPLATAGHGWAFREVSQRKGDFALVAAACMLTVAEGVCRNVRLGYANAGVGMRRIAAAEAAVTGKAPSAAVFGVAAAAAMAAARPLSDVHADADYRRDLIGLFTRQMLDEAAARAK